MKQFIFLAFSLILFSSGMSDNLLMREKIGYIITKDGTPKPSREFSKNDLEKYIVGWGWKCEEHYPIESDGRLGRLNDQRDYLPLAIGNDYLYFGTDSIIMYSHYTIGCDIPFHANYHYTYFPEKNRIEAQTFHIINDIKKTFHTSWVILSYDSCKQVFYTIKHIRKNLYYLNVYRRMTGKELQERRKKHIYTLEQAKARKREMYDSMYYNPINVKRRQEIERR